MDLARARAEFREAAVRKLAAVLTGLLETRVVVEITSDYADLSRLMGAGMAHFGWLPPAVYVRAEADCGVRLLLSGVREHQDRFRGAIFVRSDSGCESSADLADRSVAWVSPDSCSGYLFPRLALRDAGLEPGVLFGEERYLGAHEDVVRAVRFGVVEAGATYVASDHETNPEASAHSGWSGHGEMRALSISEPIPNDTICAASTVDDTLCRQVSVALAELYQGDYGRTILQELFDVQRLQRADPIDYQLVRRALGIHLGQAVRLGD